VFYKKLFGFIIFLTVLVTTGFLSYPHIKKLIAYYVDFISIIEISIFSILFIFFLGYFLCRDNKIKNKEKLKDMLLDDEANRR
jgi:predicted permease